VIHSPAAPAAASSPILRRIVLTSGARSSPSTRPNATGSIRVAASARGWPSWFRGGSATTPDVDACRRSQPADLHLLPIPARRDRRDRRSGSRPARRARHGQAAGLVARHGGRNAHRDRPCQRTHRDGHHLWYSASTKPRSPTCRSWPTRAVSGVVPRPRRAVCMTMTSLPPARTAWERCTRPPPTVCRPWPTRATKVRGTGAQPDQGPRPGRRQSQLQRAANRGPGDRGTRQR
jgi:hypothetical protein